MFQSNKLIAKFIIIALIFSIFGTNPAPVFAESTSRAAKVTDLSGTVNVQKSGGEKKFSAFKGMSLTQGDSISTGNDSWVELEIDDDKIVKISENTQLGVAELAGSIESGDDQTGLKLWFGKVWTNIKKKLNIRSKYEIRTPKTVMGVRGTQFFVGEEGGKTIVAVLEGRVYSVTYKTEQRPDGTVLEQAVEAFINKNEQAVIDHSVPVDAGITVQPVKLETLPSTILEEIKKRPEGLDQSLIKEIDKVIEVKKIEEAKQEQLQTPSVVPPPQINQPPEVTAPATPPPSSGGNNGSTTPSPQVPQARINSISAQNGYIYVNFDKILTSMPTTTDFIITQVPTDSSGTATGSGVNFASSNFSISEWDGASVTLKVPPLQPVGSGLDFSYFKYLVSYGSGTALNSDVISVPNLFDGVVVLNSPSKISAGETIQLNVLNLLDTMENPVNENGLYDDSTFNLAISSNISGVAEAVYSNVKFDNSGKLLSPAVGITLNTNNYPEIHTLTASLNGKTLPNGVKVEVLNPLRVTSNLIGNNYGFVIGPYGQTKLTFSRPLSTASMIAVQTALVSGANQSTFGCGWNAEHTELTITEINNIPLVFAASSSITCDITSADGQYTSNGVFLIRQSSYPFSILGARTLDADKNGKIDLIELTFTGNAKDSTFDGSKISFSLDGIGTNLLGDVVTSGIASGMDLKGIVDIVDDNKIYLKVIENSSYNSGTTGTFTVTGSPLINDGAGNNLGLNAQSLIDGCPPVIYDWKLKFNNDGDLKVMELYASENITFERPEYVAITNSSSKTYQSPSNVILRRTSNISTTGNMVSLNRLGPSVVRRLNTMSQISGVSPSYFLTLSANALKDASNQYNEAMAVSIPYSLFYTDAFEAYIGDMGGNDTSYFVEYTDYMDPACFLEPGIITYSNTQKALTKTYNPLTRRLTVQISGGAQDGDVITINNVKDIAGNVRTTPITKRYNATSHTWVNN
ncbi:MAG: FecR domain-containing protein [Clostridia bacterium]|nr:FecR domain-containing protein [Clostridia bacterium]